MANGAKAICLSEEAFIIGNDVLCYRDPGICELYKNRMHALNPGGAILLKNWSKKTICFYYFFFGGIQ